MENKIIEEKIQNKTIGDPIMETFITEVIENEIKNKQFNTLYKDMIKKSVKQRGEKQA